jgi:hypothetical protein
VSKKSVYDDWTVERIAEAVAKLPDSELKAHAIYGRAQLRRRKLTRGLRAFTERAQPLLEAEAERRGLDVSGWRPYPKVAADGSWGLDIGVAIELDGDQPTFTVLDRKRQAPKPPLLDAGTMLANVEHALAQRMNGRNGDAA